jgi:hypothetical protein
LVMHADGIKLHLRLLMQSCRNKELGSECSARYLLAGMEYPKFFVCIFY